MTCWQKSVVACGALVVGLAAVAPALAQPAGGPGPGGDPKAMLDRQMSMLTERLSLTADQQPKVRAILEENLKKGREIREKYRVEPGQPPDPAAREEMSKVRTGARAKLSEILTADQMKAYDKWEEERRQRGPGRGPGGPGGPGRD